MTTDEIIEMAQECKLIGMRPHLDGIYSESLVSFAKLVAAKAIAKLESQEPQIAFNAEVVGYVASQREWVGLTDDEVYKIAFALEGEHWRKVADAIEAKLKEKNT